MPRCRSRPLILLTVAVLVASTAAVLASPGHDRWTRSGTVVASDAGLLGTNPCSSLSDETITVHRLPDWAPGHGFFIQVYPTLDIDPVFYDGCTDLGSGGAPLGFAGVTEHGIVPDGADTLVIDHWAGAGRYQANVGNFG